MEDSTSGRRILALLDHRPGHVRQTEGILRRLDAIVSDTVELSFRSKRADNALRAKAVLARGIAGRRMADRWLNAALTRRCRDELADMPRPDAILSTGSSLAAPNLLLARSFGCPSIVCTRPSPIGVRPFDLAVLPLHQKAKARAKDVTTVGVPTTITPDQIADRRRHIEDAARTEGRTLRPTIGLLMGGNDGRYSWTVGMAETVVEALLATASRHGMHLAVATSRRTPVDVEAFIRARVVESPMCSYAALAHDPDQRPDAPVETILALSSWVAVTVDSLTMVCEAASSGRPVGLIAIKPRRTDRFAPTMEAIAQKTGMIRMRLPTLYELATSLVRSPPEVVPLRDAETAAAGIQDMLNLA